MKRFFTIPTLSLVVLFSCTKTTNRGIEIEYKLDTVYANARDTTFVMDVVNWDGYSNSMKSLVQPGPTTYLNTTEGIKFMSPAYRSGLRLQTKKEISFKDKTIYYKWKANGFGQFSFIAPVLKYNPLSGDANEAVQGVYFSTFSTNNSYLNSYFVQDEVWYYTRIKPMTGSDNFQVVTSTGNYENIGGAVVSARTIPVYTKSGYLSLLLSDNYSSQAYLILGELKVQSN